MSKKIDKDALIAEIKRLRDENIRDADNGCDEDQCYGYDYCLKDILKYINSLPDEPANEDLDEAAEEYFLKVPTDKEVKDVIKKIYKPGIDAFKAGAEWMARQGVTCEGRIMKAITGETYAESDYVPLDGKCGDKVIVQIRKKN